MNIKGTPQQGLFGATAGFFIGFAAVALFGVTAQKLKDVMGMTAVMVGFLVAIPSLSGSLLRIPFAAWVDTTGGRKPLLILLGLSILGMAGLTFTVATLYPDRLTPGMYPLLLLLGALSGCGIATFSVGISQVSYWFPKARQGAALGIYGGVGNLAPGLFTLILPLALGAVGLAGAYLIWLLLLIAGTALYYFTGRNAPYFQLRERGLAPEAAREAAARAGQEIFPSGNMVTSLLVSGRIWKTWVLVALYFASFGGFIALTAWLPTYWRSYFGVEAAAAGLLTATYSLLASLVRIGGGTLADRLGGERTALLAYGTLAAGALLMTLSHAFGLSLVAEIIMAAGMGVANAAVFKLVPKEVPQAVGGASGWVGGLGAFGGFAIPPILAAFVRSLGQAGYAAGFVTYVFLGLISLALALMLGRSHVRAAVPQPT